MRVNKAQLSTVRDKSILAAGPLPALKRPHQCQVTVRVCARTFVCVCACHRGMCESAHLCHTEGVSLILGAS